MAVLLLFYYEVMLVRTQIFFSKLSYFQVLMNSFSSSWTDKRKLQIGGWHYYCFIYLNRLSMIYVTILHEEHNLRLSKGFLGLFRTLQVASSGLFPCFLRYMYRDCWVADLLWLDTLRIYQSSTAYILRSLMSFFFRGVWWVAGVF